LVVNLNETTVTKPVKRENSNTTHVTGVTASTGAHTNVSNAQPAVKQSAFYNTQYKTGTKPGFFNNSDKMKMRQQQITNMVPPSSGGSNRFRTIGGTQNNTNEKGQN